MGKQVDVITLKIMRTANGYYVEHEADRVINSYSVTCEADEWNGLNPALANSFETPFSAKTEKAIEGDTDAAKTISELTAKVTALESVNASLTEKAAALTALQEAAGELDIMQLIENAQVAAEEDAASKTRNPELPLTGDSEPAAEKEAGKGSKSSSKKNK